MGGLIFGILRYAKTFAKIQDDAFFYMRYSEKCL